MHLQYMYKQFSHLPLFNIPVSKKLRYNMLRLQSLAICESPKNVFNVFKKHLTH